MPTFSAVKLMPYPPDAVFSPEPTYGPLSAPDYGFYFASTPNTFASSNSTLSQCAFDNYAKFDQFYFKDDPDKMNYLLMRYELLYKHKAGRLQGKFYPVPWLLVPSNIDSKKTIELRVSPYSIYDTNKVPRKLRKEVNDALELSNRQITLAVPGSSGVSAYWGGSGTDTVIEEKKLTKGRTIRIIIPIGQYVGAQNIESEQDVEITAGTAVLGKLRLTFCRPLSQDVCFVKIDWSATASRYEARILSPSEIPDSFEEQTPRLDQALSEALKTYCIDIVSVKDAKFLDPAGGVLISTTVSLPLDADLKPPNGLSTDAQKTYIDDKLATQLFSKVATYKCMDHNISTGQSVETEKTFQKIVTIILLPFYLTQTSAEITSGFTHSAEFLNARLVPPLRCYLIPLGKRLYDDAVLNKSIFASDPLKVTVISVASPYLAFALMHEVLHALQLGHAFPDVPDGASKQAFDAFVQKYLADFTKFMDTYDLTDFGVRKNRPTPKGQNMFELLRDSDLKSAAVSGYLWGVLNMPDFDPQSSTNPLSSVALRFMTHLNENILFFKYKTKTNMMDYQESSTIRHVSAPSTSDGSVSVYFDAPAVRKDLFRYQWELARAAVQYLSTYSP